MMLDGGFRNPFIFDGLLENFFSFFCVALERIEAGSFTEVEVGRLLADEGVHLLTGEG